VIDGNGTIASASGSYAHLGTHNNEKFDFTGSNIDYPISRIIPVCLICNINFEIE
jgi:hypothetical protein